MKFNLNKANGLISKGQELVDNAHNVLDTVQNIADKTGIGKNSAILSKGRKIIDSARNAISTVHDHSVANVDKENGLLKPEKQDENTVGKDTTSVSSDKGEMITPSQAINNVMPAVASLKVPGDVVSTISEMVKEANETMRFCEEQKTVRAEIKANAEMQITRINAMADTVRDYLNRSFDERAGIFDQYFSVLDKALESRDNTLIAQTLQSINSLATSSPFKDLADLDQVTNRLSEGGEWDI